MKNKFMLAPMTNSQSNEDGTLSEAELHWLIMRAKGQFGLVMTCASHVQENGKGFPGQLGIFSDNQIEGHTKLSEKIKSYGSLAVIQLHHAGMRTPSELIEGQPVCPSKSEKHNARELSLDEIEELKNNFINAAIRAKKCGYNGVEVHGAHGYILTQFLSSDINRRTDNYGGSLTNRARILFEIVDGIRTTCGADFLVGVRLSPERFGMNIPEIKEVCKRLIDENKIDFLDISLWDVFKKQGIRGLYRGVLPPFFGSMFYRSMQFTVFEACYTKWKDSPILSKQIPYTLGLEPRVIVAGLIASTARATIETPFEYAKVKGQTGQIWHFKDVYSGYGANLVK